MRDRNRKKITYMPGKVVEADHHDEDHHRHCIFGWHEVYSAHKDKKHQTHNSVNNVIK